MKRITVGLIILVSIGAIADAAPGVVDYSSHGFTIRELTSSDAPENSVVLEMLLPPMDGFSANVNVIIQQYSGAMSDYRIITEDQINKAGFTLISSHQISSTEIRMEYSGTQSGTELRWLQRAVKRGNRVYLVTATALASRWDTDSRGLTDTVDSLRLTK